MTRREFLKFALITLGALLINPLKAFSAPTDFVCKRCGLCCKELVEKDFWEQAKEIRKDGDLKRQGLTKEQTNFLLKERKKYSEWKKGCYMQVFEKGLATCLIYKHFGSKKRPKICAEYPTDGICLRMKREKILKRDK